MAMSYVKTTLTARREASLEALTSSNQTISIFQFHFDYSSEQLIYFVILLIYMEELFQKFILSWMSDLK
jgi:hypothetical protein